MADVIDFVRLSDVPPEAIARHMSHPRMAEHMPLLEGEWDRDRAIAFIATKETCWTRDGLGHWAFLHKGDYVGWGGFQKEGDEWDLGLVLVLEHFGLGPRIVQKTLAFARADTRIPYVTFLLPPSRCKLGALARLGATRVADVIHDGKRFLKFRLGTC